jgi:hypothetical protein
MIQVLDETAAFEHMYAPERAKALFSRHRDLTAMCEREKQILDFEWHTVSHQLDKQKNKFKLRSGRLSKRLDELAMQPPLIDPSEFCDDDLDSLPGTSHRDMRISLTGSPGRPKTASTPRSLSTKNVTSVSMYDLRDVPNEIELGENSNKPAKDVTKVRFSCHDAVNIFSPEAQGGYDALYPKRRGSAQFGKRTAIEARIRHLKQKSHLQKIRLDAKVDTFVDNIEAYKARYQREIAMKIKSEDDPVIQTKLNTRASVPLFNPFLSTQARIPLVGTTDRNDEGKENDSRRTHTKVEGQVDNGRKSEPGSPCGVTDGREIQREGVTHKRNAVVKDKCTAHEKGQLSAQRKPSNDADAKLTLKKRGQSAFPSGAKPKRDNQYRNSERPKTAIQSINRNHFSLIINTELKKKTKPIRKLPETEADVARSALTGAWEAFSSDANAGNWQHLVTFAAKHKIKKASPEKQTIVSKWRGLANQIVLTEKALSSFKGTLERQQKRKLGLLPPADHVDSEAN